jgi:signal transduction histidine kinase
MKVAWFVALVFLCIKIGNCNAQVNGQSEEWPYTFNHYTSENGLPQNSVKSIAMDPDGIVWLATESGLVRFDGQDFYTFNKTNTPLQSTRFFTLQPDLNGNRKKFYALSDNSQVVRIEGSIAVLDSLYYETKLSLIPHYRESNDKLFITSGAPNYLFSGVENTLYYLVLVPGEVGSFYILQNNKIDFFSNWKKKWTRPFHINSFEDFFTFKGELYRFSSERHIFKVGTSGENRIFLRGDILIDPIYRSNPRNTKTFWNSISDQTFILVNKNFYHLEQTSANVWNTRLILTDFDFEANNIRTVHYSLPLKKIFLGSVTNGLFVFSKKEFRTLRFGDKDMENIFYAQTLFGQRNVMTPNGSVLGLNDDTEPATLHKASNPAMQKISRYDTRSILTDRNGNIWSKSFEFLYQFDATGKKLIRSWNVHAEIKTLYEGIDGRIWIGTKSVGLLYLDAKDVNPKLYPGKSVSDVTYLTQPNNTSLWVAGQRGLFFVDLGKGATRIVKGTERLNIRALYISPDDKNAVFIATYEDGIFLLKDEKLVQFPLDGHKHLAVAHCMIEDHKGFLWITTNNGLFQVAKNDLLNYARSAPHYSQVAVASNANQPDLFYMYYTKDRGFYTNEFNGGCQPCALKLTNGYLSLPSLNGLVWFKPDQIDSNLPGNKLIFDRLDLQGKIKLVSSDTVNLSVNPRNIGFHITVPYFGDRNNLHLSYALLPVHETPSASDWTVLKSTDPVIRFSGLDYGAYTLTVKKVNGFGKDNYSVKRITIIVPPNWYETWWLRSLIVVCCLVGIYVYILFRTRYLKEKNSELEMQVERRTNSLQETLIALQASEKELNRQIHIQTRLIASISHDIRTPLKFIVASAKRIEGFIGKQEYSVIDTLSKNITSSGTRMSQLLENTIGYIKTQVYGRHVQLRPVALFPLIQEKADLFSPLMKEQSNRFVIDIEVNLKVRTNEQLLGIVIHNLLDNANKYTFEGLISITTENRGGQLHLIISDTGPGIPEHFLYWLNSSAPIDITETMMTVDASYNGLGLLIVKEISVLIEATILVENGNGTKVHVIFGSPDEKVAETE